MKRKVVGIALFCVLLLAAIFAGYWDMLSTERLRLARDRTSEAIGDLTALVAPSREAPADAAPTAPRSGEGATATAGTPPTAAAPSAPVGPGEPGPAASADARTQVQVAAVPPKTAPAVPTPAGAPAPAPAPDLAAPTEAPSPPSAAVAPSASSEPPTAGPAAAPVRAPDAPHGPSFDILRVEPDGSTVLAGRAPAGSTVRLFDGALEIGTETTGASGDFVVILGTALAVGDHEIRIQATDAAGRTTTSAETAVVSIPERGREGELLALVEAPNKPSRLISLPRTAATPVPAADATPRVAPAPSQEAEDDSRVATADPAVAAGAPDRPASASPSPSPPPAAPTAAPPSRSAAVEPAPTAPALPQAGAETLAVEAVEIEDETIYVAGRAPGGTSVRIYVDNRFVAEDARRTTNRFLVTAQTPISPGEHLVRADQVGADGTVLARVEVPFLKPDGRTMAAVSPGNGAEPAAAAPEPPREVAAAVPPANDPNRPAPPSDNPAAADPKPTTPDAMTPPPSDPVRPAAQAANDAATPPVDFVVPSPEPSIATSAVNLEAPLSPAPVPNVAAPPATSPNDAAPAVAAVLAPLAAPERPAAPETRIAAAAEPARAEPAVPPSDASAAPDAGRFETAVATTRQAPLQGVSSRVIIRRGDTLWRISRQTYGQGARYTVIYLANGDQIRNPDRIYPGQVFRVPGPGERTAVE